MEKILVNPLKINQPTSSKTPQLNVMANFGVERNLANDFMELKEKADKLNSQYSKVYSEYSNNALFQEITNFRKKLKFDENSYKTPDMFEGLKKNIKLSIDEYKKNATELDLDVEVINENINVINKKMQEVELEFLSKYHDFNKKNITNTFKASQIISANNTSMYMASGDYNNALLEFNTYIENSKRAVKDGIININDFIEDGMKTRKNLIKAYPSYFINQENGEEKLKELEKITKQGFDNLFSSFDIEVQGQRVGFSSDEYESFLKGVRQARKIFKLNKDSELQESKREIEDSIYKNDAHKYIYYTSGKKIKPTTQELLKNDDDILSITTNLDITTFGDSNNSLVFPYITPAINSGVKQQIDSLKQNPNASYRDIYQPVYTMANELADGDSLKKMAILKNWSLENNIHPTVIIEGEKNPDMFRVANLMTKGNKLINDVDFDISKIDLSKKERENFDLISRQFSGNKILGDKLATQFLLGYAINNERDRILLENPRLELSRLLNKGQMSNYLNDIKTATKFTSKAIDYHYIKLGNFYNEKVKNLEENNLSISNESQKNVFWEE